MTSPPQSIPGMLRQNNTTTPANDRQNEPLGSLIANLFARPASHLAAAGMPDQMAPSSLVAFTIGAPARTKRAEFRGGDYSEMDAINLLNDHYMVGKSKEETAIFRINEDGTISFVSSDQFKLEVQHIRVKVGSRFVPAEKSWRESPKRLEKVLVFKPGGNAGPHEYNLWRGFGVEANKGWQKQRRFLKHLCRVISRRDKQKFKYLMRLLAWFVQNPDKHAGVVLVLKSREQGTGKSTVGNVMRDIFGRHGHLVDDKDRLLGRFNDWLETACFILAEEILFAGDLKSADKMKSMITSDVLPIERKFGSYRQVANRTKVIATTNHDHAVAAGARDRRYVVFDVSNEYVGDMSYFDMLYRDLADGGTGEFLWLLQNIWLGNWHPRMSIKTEETAEQTRMSGDSVSQWSQSCIISDAIIGSDHGAERDLGALISFRELQAAYIGFCKQAGQRPVAPETFGKACTEMFGPRSRLPAGAGSKRPWGYYVPTGPNWQQEVDKRLGVK